jgi:hypothetical protein
MLCVRFIPEHIVVLLCSCHVLLCCSGCMTGACTYDKSQSKGETYCIAKIAMSCISQRT